MKVKAILLVIFAMSALVLQASASDRFQIVVHEKNGNYANDAYVEVWDGGTLVDSGYTDNSGIFYTWLERSISYRITAEGNGQNGERECFPESNEIHIKMK